MEKGWGEVSYFSGRPEWIGHRGDAEIVILVTCLFFCSFLLELLESCRWTLVFWVGLLKWGKPPLPAPIFGKKRRTDFFFNLSQGISSRASFSSKVPFSFGPGTVENRDGYVVSLFPAHSLNKQALFAMLERFCKEPKLSVNFYVRCLVYLLRLFLGDCSQHRDSRSRAKSVLCVSKKQLASFSSSSL